MDYSVLLFVAALPVVVILLMVYYRDKNKEPMSLLIKLFLSGFVSCALVVFASKILGSFLPFMDSDLTYKNSVDVFLYSFIGVALVEELCKWFMMYIISYNHKEFDELYDGIVYAVFVSLGFAFIENILYIIMTSSLSTAFLRAISAVPSHACDAIFMGYYVGLAKQCGLSRKRRLEKKYLWLSIIVPMILHGVYDYCLMSGYSILVGVFIAFVIFLYIISIHKVLYISKNNRRIKFRNRFCGNCGKAVTGEFCAYCGQRQF